MAESYEEFIVYDLKNTGERNKLSVNQEELEDRLNPEQVLIIVREDLRRIYIWKGSKSPVRKRFISSKVAQEIQKELMDDARYHRCKIVSIDQGDELQEFLNAFKLESMEVKERLPDMRYIRNVERDRMKEAERLARRRAEKGVQQEYYSPGLADNGPDLVISSISLSPLTVGRKSSQMIKPTLVKRVIGLSEEEKERIKEKILKLKVPENYERQNLILGHTIYGAVSKVTDVMGKNVVDIVWEEIKKVPEGVMDLHNNRFRVYFDHKNGMVEGIEVLRKLEINKSTPQEKRELPKIPSNKE